MKQSINGEERKVISIGNSKGITFPRGWIKYVEHTYSIKLTRVVINVSDVLTIAPLINSKTQPE